MNSADKMFKILEIQNTRGMNAKLKKLAQVPELKNILKLTYNPYIHFNIKPAKNWLQDNCGTGVFDATTSRLLQALAEEKLRGSAAKRAVLAEFERLEPMSQQLLLRILNKDMSFGMQAKSINKVWPGLIPEFQVQLAGKLEDKYLKFPIIGSYKIDGLRCIYQDGHLFTRYGRRFVGLEALEKVLQDNNCPSLDGELVVPGKSFDDLSGELRSFKSTDNVIYNVFDVRNSGSAIQCARLALASAVVTSIKDPRVHLVPYRTLVDEYEMQDMFNEAREQGFEGLVLKDEDAVAYNGRSRAWMKMKASDTVDIEVTNVLEGQGKYEGHAGKLECDFNGIKVYVGTGLSDTQRKLWWEDPNTIVGKTVEVEYMEISKNGALRHPRLKCVRGDK